MPRRESYVVWNNKGGVGKTTLTFHMATQYAINHPKCNVLVMDLCPQANVSMALLSSPMRGEGRGHLNTLYAQKKTISFYLNNVNAGVAIQPQALLTRVNDFNNQVPTNLHLLCGDMDLELVCRNLGHLRRLPPPTPKYNPWISVTSSVKYFIEGSEDGRIVGVTQIPTPTPIGLYFADWVVFIDTNPSFSVYTEMALLAAKKLIIPVNSDDFSRESVLAMLDLVYGIYENGPGRGAFKAYRQLFFSSKVAEYGLRRPLIHLLINNRTTRYQLRSAKAFGAMATGIIGVLYEAYLQHRECFSPSVELSVPLPRDKHFVQFRMRYLMEVQDFHTTGILSLHIGCPLAILKGTVNVLGQGSSVRVDHREVDLYARCLNMLVTRL